MYAYHFSLYIVRFRFHWVGFSVPLPSDSYVCLWLLILLGEWMNHFLFTNELERIAGKHVSYDEG